MDLYTNAVEYHSIKKTGEPIYNNSADHAIVVIDYLLRSAKSRIRILTGRLNRQVYDTLPVVRALDGFLDEGGVLEVISEEEIGIHSEFRKIAEYSAVESNVKFYNLDKTKKIDTHFLISDDDSYRYEPNKEDHKAVASFGDIEKTSLLSKKFNCLLNFSTISSPIFYQGHTIENSLKIA